MLAPLLLSKESTKVELEVQTLRNREAAGWEPEFWTLQPSVQSLITDLSLSFFLSFYLIINLFYGARVHVCMWSGGRASHVFVT